MFRDDREALRERIAELKARLDEESRENVRLREALPENARAVLERRKQELEESANEQRRALEKQIQEARDAMARDAENTPAPPATPEQRRADNMVFVAIFMLLSLAVGVAIGFALGRAGY